jgi:hypothetical protein
MYNQFPVQICRIRGLVKDASEVQVNLLTNSEAIEMLCKMAGLGTTGVVPTAVMPVIRLCGNLPLCLGIVAGTLRPPNCFVLRNDPKPPITNHILLSYQFFCVWHVELRMSFVFVIELTIEFT